jgi:ribosome-associated protein
LDGLVSPTLEIPIRDETIRLGQLLKLAGVVDDGAQARELIENGEVTVDGEVDRRRGRQVRPGSLVRLGDTELRVITSPS